MTENHEQIADRRSDQDMAIHLQHYNVPFTVTLFFPGFRYSFIETLAAAVSVYPCFHLTRE